MYIDICCFRSLRGVPFKSCVGGGRRNRRFFEGGRGSNSELCYPIRLYMISGRRGGGCWILYYLPFLPPPPTTLLNGTALTTLSSLNLLWGKMTIYFLRLDRPSMQSGVHPGDRNESSCWNSCRSSHIHGSKVGQFTGRVETHVGRWSCLLEAGIHTKLEARNAGDKTCFERWKSVILL